MYKILRGFGARGAWRLCVIIGVCSEVGATDLIFLLVSFYCYHSA